MTVDLFCVIGQSNADGRGSASLSPKPSMTKAIYVDNTTIEPLHDPGLGSGMSVGSMWPAFGTAWYAATGRRCAIVAAAVGGTALVPAADGGAGDWSPTGACWPDATAKVAQAHGALRDRGYGPILRGFLWSQGERDAQSAIAQATYRDALIELAEDRITAKYAGTKLYVWRTGRAGAGDTSAWQAIRAAQDEAAATSESIVMAHTDAVNYPDLGLMADNLHWGQVGLNNAGTTGAEVVADDVYSYRMRRVTGVDGPEMRIVA